MPCVCVRDLPITVNVSSSSMMDREGGERVGDNGRRMIDGMMLMLMLMHHNMVVLMHIDAMTLIAFDMDIDRGYMVMVMVGVGSDNGKLGGRVVAHGKGCRKAAESSESRWRMRARLVDMNEWRLSSWRRANIRSIMHGWRAVHHRVLRELRARHR